MISVSLGIVNCVSRVCSLFASLPLLPLLPASFLTRSLISFAVAEAITIRPYSTTLSSGLGAFVGKSSLLSLFLVQELTLHSLCRTWLACRDLCSDDDDPLWVKFQTTRSSLQCCYSIWGRSFYHRHHSLIFLTYFLFRLLWVLLLQLCSCPTPPTTFAWYLSINLRK